MYRYAISQLEAWKIKNNRKPLIIEGARQVGKTWLMKEFGKTFKDYLYVNFDNNQQMNNLFSANLDIRRIIEGIEIYCGKKIDPQNTLLIFDEIQEVPTALSSLKYFYENAPEYYIVCAGSLLGIALHQGTSFPVGKVDFIKLYPMSFKEFMLALGEDNLVQLLQNKDYDMIKNFKDNFIDKLKQYYIVGGMPEVVQSYVYEKDFNLVKDIQKRILNAYEMDFSKHAPYNIVPKIRMIWNSIPSQLAKENRKFIYGNLKEGARAKEFEIALLWLSDCGLVHKVHRINQASLPLKAYEDIKAFKLFLLDVGLLSCMSGLNSETILDGNDLFKEFKGSLSEQYVLQQLKTLKDIDVYYYTNERNSCEVDFVVDNKGLIIPIEVKAEINLSAKSLKVYCNKFQPQFAIRTAMTDYKAEDWLINLPLYLIEEM
ncbi:MAG: ATP-binding protein [Erysipelotrichaceae bacterium]